MSTQSINIQVDKGNDTGLYEYYTVKRENLSLACKFRIRAVLNDCTDQHASPGRNEYRIGAEFSSGAAMSITYFVDTLPQDRTYCFISMAILLMFCKTASPLYSFLSSHPRARFGPKYRNNSNRILHTSAWR